VKEQTHKENNMPAICRGDMVDVDVVHCSVPRRLEMSPDVFVNGIGISRQGDNNHPHLIPVPPCPVHQAPITIGSTTVFINGKGCGRIGDDVSGCTVVASGSINTFAGP
jgi:uncharacterized Zn-binding protein involved in type VI secretion